MRCWRRWPGRVLCITLVSLAPALLLGATEHDTVTPTERATKELLLTHPLAAQGLAGDLAAKLDAWHDWLFLKVQDYIERTDGYFAPSADERLPVPASPFRIGLESDFIKREQGMQVTPRLDVDVLLNVPNIERRLHIFITSDNVQETPNALTRASSGVRAGLRLTPLQFVDFDIGVRADVPPVAFASARWQRHASWGGWELLPFVKLYVESGVGPGAAVGLTFDHWHERWLFRASSYANYILNHNDTQWTQALILAQAHEVIGFNRNSDVVGGRDLARGYGVQLLASGSEHEGPQSYETSIFFKQPTANRWLYWHIAPLLRWDQQYHWHPDPGIRIGFDALFWDLSSRR